MKAYQSFLALGNGELLGDDGKIYKEGVQYYAGEDSNIQCYSSTLDVPVGLREVVYECEVDEIGSSRFVSNVKEIKLLREMKLDVNLYNRLINTLAKVDIDLLAGKSFPCTKVDTDGTVALTSIDEMYRVKCMGDNIKNYAVELKKIIDDKELDKDNIYTYDNDGRVKQVLNLKDNTNRIYDYTDESITLCKYDNTNVSLLAKLCMSDNEVVCHPNINTNQTLIATMLDNGDIEVKTDGAYSPFVITVWEMQGKYECTYDKVLAIDPAFNQLDEAIMHLIMANNDSSNESCVIKINDRKYKYIAKNKYIELDDTPLVKLNFEFDSLYSIKYLRIDVKGEREYESLFLYSGEGENRHMYNSTMTGEENTESWSTDNELAIIERIDVPDHYDCQEASKDYWSEKSNKEINEAIKPFVDEMNEVTEDGRFRVTFASSLDYDFKNLDYFCHLLKDNDIDDYYTITPLSDGGVIISWY